MGTEMSPTRRFLVILFRWATSLCFSCYGKPTCCQTKRLVKVLRHYYLVWKKTFWRFGWLLLLRTVYWAHIPCRLWFGFFKLIMPLDRQQCSNEVWVTWQISFISLLVIQIYWRHTAGFWTTRVTYGTHFRITTSFCVLVALTLYKCTNI